MQNKDFELTYGELEKLNNLIKDYAEAFKASDEIADGLEVTFAFSPVGRVAYLKYSGGKEIILNENEDDWLLLM